MTDMYPPPAPGQHDTTAIPRPYPQVGGAPGFAPGYGPYPPGFGPGAVPGNPAADAWESKYRSQRTRTRVAMAVAGVTSAVALVLGAAAWQLSQNPLLGAASQLASGLGEGGLQGIAPPATTPEDSAPGTTPEESVPEGQAPDSTDIPLEDLPLPDGLASLASTLGITDVGQLLDLAVANGIMSQEDADKVRAGIAAGALVQGLTQQQ